MRAIAKASGTSVAEVNRVIDRWVETSVSPEPRKQTLALGLARLEQLQLMFYRRAMEGDVPSGALVAKLIERRFVMLGLHAPQTAVLQVVDEAAPRLTSTNKIDAAFNALLTAPSRKKDDDPTTH